MRQQRSALTRLPTIKTTNTTRSTIPDKSDLLTKDLKAAAVDCTVSDVIFSEFRETVTHSQENAYVGWYVSEKDTVSTLSETFDDSEYDAVSCQ